MSHYHNSVTYKPNTVQLELVQGCDRRCKFCGTNGIERKLHFIEKSVLKKECQLIAESGYNPRILIAMHGEPTLHPNFYACIKLIRKTLPKHWIQLMTNGYSIKKDLANITAMFEAGLNDITLDEYKDNKFDDEEIIALLEQYEQDTGIHVEFVRMRKGVPLYAPKQYKKRRLLIVPAIDETEITMSRKLMNHCGAGMPPSRECVDKVCTKVFREIAFRWDGSVAICCNDFRGQYPVANCLEVDTFDELWRHKRLESARRILYHDGRKFFPCNVCNCVAIRPGLLPDHLGKQSMEKPTIKDYSVVEKNYESLSIIKPRKWEQ